MESGYKHFIRTIRRGVEIKVCNIDSQRRPALAFKSLTEVYESEEAKRFLQRCVVDSCNTDIDSVLDSDQMKSRTSFLSKVVRKSREIKPRADNFTPCSDNDMGSDLDDDTTLEQLRERSKPKRKKISYMGLHSVKADEDKNNLQDEPDLDEPLIRLKLKLSKNSIAKRTCVNGSLAMSSTIAFTVKSEQNLVSEDCLLVGHETAPVIHDKTEAPQAEHLGCQSTCSADHLSIDHDKGSSYCGVEPNKFLELVQSENREPLLPVNDHQFCFTNEISYDHLEDIEPTCMIIHSDSVGVKEEILELSCPEFPVLSPTFERRNEVGRSLSCRSEPFEYCDPDVLCQSSMEEISCPSHGSGIQVSDIAADNNDGSMGLNHEIDINLTKEEVELDFPEKLDDYLKRQESSPENKFYGGSHVHSTPEQHQHPERLLSTRKAISPSTREKLCLAMESIEHCNDVKKNSLGKFSQRKDVTHPRQIIQKPNKTTRNDQSSRISRSLPNLSTGCASIKYCSESAIVFSQRQMHDTESLTMRLLSELKSMKDIVEQKLLFEAYRNASLKNDADEVKLAIDNATKTEEAATKWLNMMSRDCNRFCKIMKLSPNNIDTYKYAAPREGKKIRFADEVGGELCHVKYFDDTAVPLVSDCIDQ
ncbi:hypothetical protein F511_01046 [Dorcoceras hygrometricum]|uniref:Uncharacterized protein n=1 Tax=Dorcoceras hygrometricum TaxID=472368 RepID=A0A2Z7ALW4_9LAMI|nr:hypothetical protein F511_01046 [Dorcoceras hygrometricum]